MRDEVGLNSAAPAEDAGARARAVAAAGDAGASASAADRGAPGADAVTGPGATTGAGVAPDVDGPAAGTSARIALCAVRESPLSVDEVLDAIADPSCGGQVLFIGRVRDHDHERDVVALDYQAHPDASARMAQVCAGVASAYDVRAVAATHRVGHLAIGEIAVVVGVAAAHRGAAFDAGRALIDTLKATVPIWKHQVFSDGGDEWVGLP